jgi:predicted  nucleic acid-binding Zn-ribbon protein
MSDIDDVETRIERLHHLLRHVEDETAAKDLRSLLAEANNELARLREKRGDRHR